jgi:hypothetical protein
MLQLINKILQTSFSHLILFLSYTAARNSGILSGRPGIYYVLCFNKGNIYCLNMSAPDLL